MGRIKLDKLTQGMEISGRDNPQAYARRSEALSEAVAKDTNEKRFKNQPDWHRRLLWKRL